MTPGGLGSSLSPGVFVRCASRRQHDDGRSVLEPAEFVALGDADSAREDGGPSRLRIEHEVTREAPGTVVIDTPNTHLYYVLGGGQAIRYGIGVGRDGFTWPACSRLPKRPSGRIGPRLRK